jgi:hypothetical protein
LSVKYFRDDWDRPVRAIVGEAENFTFPTTAGQFLEKRLLKKRPKRRANAGFLIPCNDADGDLRRINPH